MYIYIEWSVILHQLQPDTRLEGGYIHGLCSHSHDTRVYSVTLTSSLMVGEWAGALSGWNSRERPYWSPSGVEGVWPAVLAPEDEGRRLR